MIEQDIKKGLLRRATHVASTDTEEHDRYGDWIGINIYAVHVGQMTIVITYCQSEYEEEYHLEIDCVGPIDELKDMVERVHDNYYEVYTCGFYVKNDLKDKLRSISKYLDKLYVPTEGESVQISV